MFITANAVFAHTGPIAQKVAHAVGDGCVRFDALGFCRQYDLSLMGYAVRGLRALLHVAEASGGNRHCAVHRKHLADR